jgi:hypothetical protein
MTRHFCLSSVFSIALALTGCSAGNDTIPYFPDWEDSAETALVADDASETPVAGDAYPGCRGSSQASRVCERLERRRLRLGSAVLASDRADIRHATAD